MTVKEIISNKEESGFSSGYSMDSYYHTEEDIEEMLQEYAKLNHYDQFPEMREKVIEELETMKGNDEIVVGLCMEISVNRPFKSLKYIQVYTTITFTK